MTQEITIPTPSPVVNQITKTTRSISSKKPTKEELQALWDKEQIRKAKHKEKQASYYKKQKEAGKKYATVLVDTAYDKKITEAGYKRIGILYSKGNGLPFEVKSLRIDENGNIYLEYVTKNGEIYEIPSIPTGKGQPLTR